MNIFDATVLGIIEGLSEFLPISSTAHLILGANLLGLEQSVFLKSFEIIIQLGAILAVVTLYFKSFLSFETLKKVAFGFVPTAFLGLVFYKAIKNYLGDISVVLWSLLLGGIFLIFFEMYLKRKGDKGTRNEMTWKECMAVGFFQSIAFIPGVSRSAATIVGGLSLGISRATIAEYSFLLAVPTMAAATGLDIVKNRDALLHSGNLFYLFIGFAVSYFVALFAIKAFLSYIKKHDFKPFGFYRIVVAIIFFLSL